MDIQNSHKLNNISIQNSNKLVGFTTNSLVGFTSWLLGLNSQEAPWLDSQQT